MKIIELIYDKTIGGNLADKPIMNEDGEELCICAIDKYGRGKVTVHNIHDYNKPRQISTDIIYFDYLKDRKIYVSIYLLLKDDDYAESLEDKYGQPNGEFGYQMVLRDLDDFYLLDYVDGFILGDSKGGDDFQKLTADWQW